MKRLSGFAKITNISKPFNADRTIEVKLEFEEGDVAGEIYLRVSPSVARQLAIDEVFGIRLMKF